MIRSFLTLALGLSLLSCGKGGLGNPFGSDDPFDGLPDYIRDAQGGRREKPSADTLRPEEMIISSSQTYFPYQENVSAEYTITGRVLRPGYTAEVSIDNLAEFSGATFDASTGVFRWTPPVGTVKGGKMQEDLTLKVKLKARSPSGRSTNKDGAFSVFVRPTSLMPAIVGNDLNYPFLREGTTNYFNVKVKYRGVAGQTTPVDLRLIIDRPANSMDKDLSKYITQAGDPTQDAGDPSVWNYRLMIDLNEVDLTKSSADFKFQIQFQNPDGLKSAASEFMIPVRTNLVGLASTASRSVIRVKAGARFEKEIVVYDPRDEGYVFVEVPRPDPKPAGMTVECVSGDLSNSQQICKVVWDVQSPVGTNVEMELRAQSKSQAVGDDLAIQQSFFQTFEVIQ